MSTEPKSRTVSVAVPPRPVSFYKVGIGGDGIRATGSWLASHCVSRRIAIVAEKKVSSIGELLATSLTGHGFKPVLFSFEGGEDRKTRTQKRALENDLLEHGFARDSILVAVGGGVTCDLTGFIASTYYRGIPWIALPTTLLAMVDAAVGGKTAVNTPHGKNLIGTHHHPDFVYCDPFFLSTLPEREMRSGLAEVAKAALLEGDDRVSRLRELAPKILSGDREALEETIEAAVRLKGKIVKEDYEDQDYRQVLNLGHTLGHSVEAVSGYELRHGEAMAIGMALEARLSELARIANKGLANQVEGLLEELGLPTHLPRSIDPEQVLARLIRDKKVREGRPRFALLERPGKPHLGAEGWAVPLPEKMIRQILMRNRS